MKDASLLVRYSARLLMREWRRYALPFLSLFLTALVISSAWMLTGSGQSFLSDKQKELLGGDVEIESSYPFPKNEIADLFSGSKSAVSFEYDFFATTKHKETSAATSIRVVDEAFPLYGDFLMTEGEYAYPGPGEIFIDENLAKKLSASLGSVLFFNMEPYTVRGVWKREPDALSSSQFFPKALLSTEGFERSGLDMSLLRIEHTVRAKFLEKNAGLEETIIGYAKEKGFQLRIAGSSSSRFERGLGTVSTFLVVAVLLSCVLAAVNVYASTLYLLKLLRRSFATLIALGFTKKKLSAALFLSLLYLVLATSLLGSVISAWLFGVIQNQISVSYSFTLPQASLTNAFLVTFLLTFATMLASYIPSLRNTLTLSPRALLLGIEEDKDRKMLASAILITISTLLPLVFVAWFLLADFSQGLLSVLAVVALYALLAIAFLSVLGAIYRRRGHLPFFLRVIISEKKSDGFFGLVSFTSLFVALVSLVTLALLQASLASFLASDVGRTIPPTYLIDVQKSQKEKLTESFPDVILFPNVGARIISIDGVAIQEALARGDESVSRELGREYNLTYRNELLDTENIVAGSPEIGRPGEISLDREFGERIGASLGSRFVFSIQGFQVSGVVTNIRETESRSGLPFFFFVMSPEDISKFPTTFFGYSYGKGEYQTRLNNFLAQEMPNVSLINTEEISALAASIVQVLLLLVFAITVPPLALATLLVSTLIVSSYEARRRDGARLVVLGATNRFIEKLYLLESVSVTLVSSVIAYAIGALATYILAKHYLELPKADFFDKEIIFILFGLLVSIMAIAVTLSRTDKRTIRETLIYEENE